MILIVVGNISSAGCINTNVFYLFQILAVLAAVTEVIKAQGGKESETEYFGALASSDLVQ